MEKPVNSSDNECLRCLLLGPPKRVKSCHGYFVNKKSSIVDEDENNEHEEEIEWESDEEEEVEEFQSESNSETWYVGVRRGLTQQRLLHLRGCLLLQQLLLRLRPTLTPFLQLPYSSPVPTSTPSSVSSTVGMLLRPTPSSSARLSALAPSSSTHPPPSISSSQGVVDSRILILPTIGNFNKQSDCVKVITKIMKAHLIEVHPNFGKVPNRMKKNVVYRVRGKCLYKTN
ncbi:hypothetical protein M9H77_02534 [Catharanthus roseus]|uniref:Uncharacterized protein n=1 Tax=Catharanthus roseus TaxID=4058 RepID=A0ACC0C8N7_CATRO|nr:hypothetical protein M9H77_02534 [Catharanthus roseus]